MTIGEVAESVGVGVETIRFYEREGLIPEPPRRSSGYRQYEPSAVNRGYELFSQELGMFAERFLFEDLDRELDGMGPEELHAFVRSVAMEVGLRMVDMSDDETREFILKHAERVGLRVEPAPTHQHPIAVRLEVLHRRVQGIGVLVDTEDVKVRP